VICAHTPEHFLAISLWYQNFEQTSDREVNELLRKSRAAAGQAQPTQARASEGAATGS